MDLHITGLKLLERWTDLLWNSVFLKIRLHDEIYWLIFYPNSLIHILSLSNLHNNVASIQKNQGDKSHHVILVSRPVTITLRFHLLFTWKRWKRSWKCKHFNRQHKVDRLDNAMVWERNGLKMHPCNRGLSLRKVCYKNLIHYIKVSLVLT